MAPSAVVGGEGYERLAEAYPAVEALGVALRLAQLSEGVDAAAVEEAEVAHVDEHLGVGQALQDAIVDARQVLAHEALAAACLALGVDVLIALLPELEHLGDDHGGMLQVGVDDGGAVARDVVEAGEHGALLAEVAREVDVADAWVVLAESADLAEGLVGATVVDHDDFPIVLALALEEPREGLVEGLYVALLVVAGNDDGYSFHVLSDGVFGAAMA